MNPIVAGFAGLALGLALGVLAMVWWRTRERARRATEAVEEVADPVVPEGAADVIAILGSAVAVVGPHDEILQHTTSARALGIVRGSRIAVPELLQMVRDTRRDAVIRTGDLDLNPGVAPIHLAVRVAPLHDQMVILLCEDQTVARRSDEVRRDFVINVSHELKTPIGALGLLAEAVEAAAEDPDAVRNFAGLMHREAERLAVLVSQIIQLARLQADEPLTKAIEVEVDDVIAAAVDRCRVDAAQRDITITVGGEHGLQVLGDADQLGTAVGNLVENAVAYSDSGARVAVAATLDEDDGGWVEISVTDNGIGINAADLDRIFERFYRVDYARSRSNGGTGLGLSIVKHVAAVHGGDVEVWSQPGQGSTFTLRIPARHHAGARAAAASSGGAGSSVRGDGPPVTPRPAGGAGSSVRGDGPPVTPRPAGGAELHQEAS